MTTVQPELEPTVEYDVRTIDQFRADIAAYHEALRDETGADNPDILVEDLFEWTEPAHHAELRSAIFQQTEGDWVLKPIIDDSGDPQLVLSYDKDKFHYC